MRVIPDSFPKPRAWLVAALLGFFLLACQASAETLREKQSRFAGLTAELIVRAREMGYEVTLGEAWRTEEQASFNISETKINAEKGIGIVASLHRLRLAIDLNLFRNGKFLTSPKDYEPLGVWWEKRCADCRWGGRFKRNDAVHFSVTHGGIR